MCLKEIMARLNLGNRRSLITFLIKWVVTMAGEAESRRFVTRKKSEKRIIVEEFTEY